MKALIYALLILATLLFSAPAQESPPAPPGQSLSASKQFIIKGGDARGRGAVAFIAEDLVRELQGLLEFDEAWKHRIIVSLEGEVADARPPFPFLRQVVTGPRLYELRCHIGQGLQLDQLEAQLLQMILLEICLRDVADDELNDGLAVPAWAVSGLLEAIRFKNDQSDRRAYQRIYESGALMPIDRILAVERPQKLDGPTLGIFTASAGALVMALEAQEGGPSGLTQAIRSLILDPDAPRASLQRHFPGLNLSQKSLEKWWALQLANMATPLASDALDIRETDQNLEEILSFPLAADAEQESRRLTIEAYPEILGHPRGERLFTEAQQRLTHLSYRCFPEYRPLILEYARILNELSSEQDAENDQSLKNLRADRQILVQLAERTRDYLDWYEITQPTGGKGRFKEYREALDGLRRKTAKRQDPISHYLDAVERFQSPPKAQP